MLWWLIILLLFAIVAYLVFAPFYLEINTVEELLNLRFHRAASASLLIKDNSLVFLVRILGWKKEITLPLTQKSAEKKLKAKKAKKFNIPFRKIWAIIKSFRVSKCYIAIDTGYMPYNGLLYPLVRWLSLRTGKTIFINFKNENEVVLEIKNNAARMLWAYIRA